MIFTIYNKDALNLFYNNFAPPYSDAHGTFMDFRRLMNPESC